MTMRILVTGADGFIGRHVCNELATAGHTVIGTHHVHTLSTASVSEWVPLDLADEASIARVVDVSRPDAVMHLASPAYVPDAQAHPAVTIELVLRGTMWLLQRLLRENRAMRVLYVGSAEAYGLRECSEGLSEDALPRPRAIYGVTKLAAELLALSYASDQLHVAAVRPFNQVGPHQDPRFAVSSFAHQIAGITRAGRGELRVGNLDVERDFIDVEDSARAHVLALLHGERGSVYNICSGRPTRLRDLVDAMIAEVGGRVELVVDPERVRPNEVRRFFGSRKRLGSLVGWEPKSTPEAAAVRALRAAMDARP